VLQRVLQRVAGDAVTEVRRHGELRQIKWWHLAKVWMCGAVCCSLLQCVVECVAVCSRRKVSTSQIAAFC